jgi:hypothetical protein
VANAILLPHLIVQDEVKIDKWLSLFVVLPQLMYVHITEVCGLTNCPFVVTGAQQ